ncbi:MAG: metalloregulator ArsR/SmtB family transcription factor [Planctomycetota bacterium]|nr:metalloregulator ArsR/SmtB family transcription factor [Planctomycetota bacterium]
MKSSEDSPPLLSWLSTLSDLARLRMLRLLEQQELSVGELARAMQLPQSTVSRHLKNLSDGVWITKRSEGTASLYRMAPDRISREAMELWTLTKQQLGSPPALEEDDARLDEVLAQRRTDSKSFFGRLGSEWDQLRRELFGDQFTLEALLSLLPGDSIVADLGCGTGNAAEFLAPQVMKVVAIDREPAMLEAAKKRLVKLKNVEFRLGELDALPLEDDSIDITLLLLVLHHIDDPVAVINEVARTLRPGGMALIVDMIAHDRESYRHTMGHVHLGFKESTVKSWVRKAGLRMNRFQRLRPDTRGKGPGLFVATMMK